MRRSIQTRRRTREHANAGAWLALAAFIIELAGCAPGSSLPPANPSMEAPMQGVFTGEYVDGKPLYRLPPIEVVGSRSSVTQETSSGHERG